MSSQSVFDDPRVEKISEYFYNVKTDDAYGVRARSRTSWTWSPALGSKAMHEANLGTREESEAWMEEHIRGPFYSAELALQDLIARTG